MRHSQRGVTFLGWVLLLIPVAMVVYCGIRLTPVYLNYFRVTRSMAEVAQEAKTSDATSAQTLRSSLDKHFNVDYIDHPDIKDIDIHREGDHWVEIADYEETVPLFSNISLLLQFHHEVDIS